MQLTWRETVRGVWGLGYPHVGRTANHTGSPPHLNHREPIQELWTDLFE